MNKTVKKPKCTLCNDSGFKPIINPDYDDNVFCRCPIGHDKLDKNMMNGGGKIDWFQFVKETAESDEKLPQTMSLWNEFAEITRDITDEEWEEDEFPLFKEKLMRKCDEIMENPDKKVSPLDPYEDYSEKSERA